MKYLVTFFILATFCNSLLAKSELPVLESKMWNFLITTQVQDNKIVRTKGGWPSFSRFRGTNIHSQESNSFVTSQLLVALSEVEKSYHFPRFEEASIEANEFLDKFLEDTNKTNEAQGTIAYWPLLKTSSGKSIRSFSTKFPYRHLKSFNVPNDLDASANYFMWLHLSNNHPEYLHAFEKSSGHYLDLKRKSQYKNDYIWKPANSGAFVTWVDEDKIDNPESRIYKGVNDVDCVVNLNILTALLTYKNHLGNLSTETENGMKASCKLINDAIFYKKTSQCAVWYDRRSQFYTAYSKAFMAQEKIDCLDKSLDAAKEEILLEVNNSLLHLGNGKYTEIAEYISAIKKLWPLSQRPVQITEMLKKLEDELKKGIIIQDNVAFISSSDSLFVAKLVGGLVTIDWYSPQFSTALALEALLLP